MMQLKRSLSLWMITLYGLGTIIGAGIYVLVGEVVAQAGYAAPLAFLMAAVLALFSALSYAELVGRFPLSAGAAIYVQRAFGWPQLSRLIGLMVIAVAVVSSATLANGFVGYLQVFVQMPEWLVIVSLLLLVGGLACWGITESALTAVVTTLIEIGGLLLILWVTRGSWQGLPEHLPEMVPEADWLLWAGVMGGAFVAFYAFIGFEDIVTVAEEVKEPSRNLPLAVMLSLGITTLLYLMVTMAAVLQVPPGRLGGNDAPLALVYEDATGRAPHFISLVSLVAVINGALIQIILAARVLYGMAREGWLPGWLARVNAVTQTPLEATVLAVAVVLLFALWLPLVTLAELTSFITLVVFSLVNLALIRVKLRDPMPLGIRVFPLWVPVAGFVASAGFLVVQLVKDLWG